MIRARGAGGPLPLSRVPAAPLPAPAAGAPDTPEEGRHFREDSPAAPSRWRARQRSPAGPAARPALLARLRRELASPAALRLAIVVHEVLGPPKGLR